MSAAAAAGPTDAPKGPAVPLATESQYYPTVIDAAHIGGWRVAHFRPARTARGWRTAVQGDGAGFPDFVLVHGGAGRIWFVELKMPPAKLTDQQKLWGETIIRAGGVYRVVYCPDGIDAFCQDLIDAVRPL